MIKPNIRGFSLLEILVVIIIIGILAAIGIPSYMNTMEKSRSAEVYPVFAQARKGYRIRVVNEDPAPFNISDLTTGSASNAEWAKIDMDNPNANSNGFFCYNGSSGSGTTCAGRNAIIATRRNAQTAYASNCDSARWLCIDVDSGEIFKSNSY